MVVEVAHERIAHRFESRLDQSIDVWMHLFPSDSDRFYEGRRMPFKSGPNAVVNGGEDCCEDATVVTPPVTPPVDRALLDEVVALDARGGPAHPRWFRSVDLAVDSKGDGTPVTAADRAAERFIRERLAATHPDDAIVGEEEADVAGTSGRRWIVDPIDGTKAFTHGVPLYCTLLAFEDEHGPAVGVIDLPALGRRCTPDADWLLLQRHARTRERLAIAFAVRT